VPVSKYLVVQMRPGRPTRATHVGDMLTSLDLLALGHMTLADMRISRHEAFSVCYLDDIAVGVLPA
jgi:hypothetical protein